MSPRGGARANSGRKPRLREPVKLTFVIEADALDKLDHWRHSFNLTRSEAIRYLLDHCFGRVDS